MTITGEQGRDLGRLSARMVEDWRESGPATVASLLSVEDRETLERLVFLMVGARAEQL